MTRTSFLGLPRYSTTNWVALNSIDLILSHQVWNQGLSRAMVPPMSTEENPSYPLPASGGARSSLVCSFSLQSLTSLSHVLFLPYFLCVSVSKSLFLIKTLVMGLRAILIHYDLIEWITTVDPLFPNKAIFWDSGWTWILEGTLQPSTWYLSVWYELELCEGVSFSCIKLSLCSILSCSNN